MMALEDLGSCPADRRPEHRRGQEPCRHRRRPRSPRSGHDRQAQGCCPRPYHGCWYSLRAQRTPDQPVERGRIVIGKALPDRQAGIGDVVDEIAGGVGGARRPGTVADAASQDQLRVDLHLSSKRGARRCGQQVVGGTIDDRSEVATVGHASAAGARTPPQPPTPAPPRASRCATGPSFRVVTHAFPSRSPRKRSMRASAVTSSASGKAGPAARDVWPDRRRSPGSPG